MSLINFIQKIQSKPRHIRLQILWLTVFVSMLVITSLWVVSLKSSLSIDDKNNNSKNEQNVNSDMPSLKDAFKASINAFFEDEETEDKQIESQNKIEIQDINESNEIKPAKLPLSK